jgi:hypothetical protein
MLPGSDQENTEMVALRIQEVVNNTDVVVPGVCVLPPMKVVMGSIRMKAFVSSRKLVDDAFATLEQNRANIIETIEKSAMETAEAAENAETTEPLEVALEPESPVAAVSVISTCEPQSMELLVEPFPAAPYDSSSELAAETQRDEDVLSDNISPEIVPEEIITDSNAMVPAVRPDESTDSTV